jgi:hypothetical protein
MRKTAIVLGLTAVIALVAVILSRNDDEPVVVGHWHELRPPDFE